MYYKLGKEDKARAAAKTLIKLFKDKLIWFSTFSTEDFDMIFNEFDVTFRYLYRGVIDQVAELDTDDNFKKNYKTILIKLFLYLII